VHKLVFKYAVSKRKACGLVNLDRASFYYCSRRKDQSVFYQKIKELAYSRPRYGYQRIHVLLRREGVVINKKRVHRIYRELGLSLRLKNRKKRALHVRGVLNPATKPNERWSIDFMHDSLFNGKHIRIFNVVDNYSRECLGNYVDTSIDSSKTVCFLNNIVEERGKPEFITMDNGSEFRSKLFDEWAYKNKINLDFITPGKPVQNCFIESFNGRLRDECLNGNYFLSLEDARSIISLWREDYNKFRPHSSLNNLTPQDFSDEFLKKMAS
jgi:putative transposase